MKIAELVEFKKGGTYNCAENCVLFTIRCSSNGREAYVYPEDCPVHGNIQVVFGNRDEHNMIEEDIHMVYITNAMSEAVYEKIGDNEYTGKIPSCWGVISFASTLEECKEELLSVLEDWILVGLRFGHPLPAFVNHIPKSKKDPQYK